MCSAGGSGANVVPSAEDSSQAYKTDTAQAFSTGLNAAGSVLSLGTTAPGAKPHGKSGGGNPDATPEWWADLEHVWRSRTEGARERLQLRAKTLGQLLRRQHATGAAVGPVAAHPLGASPWSKTHAAWLPSMRVKVARSQEWADHRARAVALARQDVLASCDQRWRSVACGCTRHEFKVGCDQPQLCARCRVRHSRKWWRRIVNGMDAALRDERAAWYKTPAHRRRGMKPGIYLLTVTAPHSGDMVTDRNVIGAGVRKLLKHATKHRWWSTYALTWEATAGEDGQGHVHCHLAVISSWIPYTSANVVEDDAQQWCPRRKGERRAPARGLHEVWMEAVPGAIQPDVQAPRKGSDEASSAGYYLAKYVTKGVDAAEFTGRKAGELLVALRGKRKVSTSADFWRDKVKRCECCGDIFRSLGAPCALQDIAPGAVLRSMAERAGWFIPRGAPQIPLRAVNSDTPMSLDPGERTRGLVAP